MQLCVNSSDCQTSRSKVTMLLILLFIQYNYNILDIPNTSAHFKKNYTIYMYIPYVPHIMETKTLDSVLCW